MKYKIGNKIKFGEDKIIYTIKDIIYSSAKKECFYEYIYFDGFTTRTCVSECEVLDKLKTITLIE